MKHLATLLGLFVFALSLTAQPTSNTYKNEISFTPNHGQVLNERGETATDVLAKASVPGMDMYLTTTGLSYVFLNYEEDKDAPVHPVYVNDKKHKIHYSRVDVDLVGATLTAAQMQWAQPTITKTNHYYTNIRVEGLEHFQQVIIANVYPGIDWVWKVNQKGQLEYDFVIHPNANASLIKMEYRFATPVAEGTRLKVNTKNGGLTEGELLAFNETTPVPVTYALNGNTVSFNIPAYDKSKELVIDPPLVLNWSALYGGASADCIRGVTTDAQGNIYMVGYTTSTNFPVWNGVPGAYFDGTYNGSTDAFLIKLTPTPNLVWATYMGGSFYDAANSVSIDAQQRVLVAGTASTGFPTVSAGGYINGPVDQDAFVARFSASLTLGWSTAIGGLNADEALKVYADKKGGIWLTGYATTTFPAYSNAQFAYNNSTVTGGTDAFVVLFDSLTNRVWASTYGGSGDDYATSCVADTAGKLYVAGFTAGGLPAGNNLSTGQHAGGIDGFIWEPVTNGRIYLGGSSNDLIMDIAATTQNHLFVTGRTVSTNFPTQYNNGLAYYQAAKAGAYDAFIARYITTTYGFPPSMDWSTYYGGATNDDGANAIACDKDNRVYITGFTASTDFPMQASSMPGAFYQGTKGGQQDGFIVGFSKIGKRFWSTYKGGACNEFPHDISCSASPNKIYVVGEGLYSCGQSVPDSGAIGNGGGNGFAWAFDGVNTNCHTISIIDVTAPCPDSCNGSATVSITGGQAPYSTWWGTGDTTTTISICGYLLPGNNNSTVMVVDDYGCAAEEELVYHSLYASIDTVPIDCWDDGVLWGYAEGGLEPYTFYWGGSHITGLYTNVHFEDIATASVAGIYQLGVYDARGCLATTEIYLDYENHPTSNNVTVITQPNCGENNGIIAVTSPSSDPWFDYAWTINGVPEAFYGDTIYNAGPGVYALDTFYAECYNGEFLHEPTVVDSTFALDVQLAFVNPSCNVQGSVIAAVTGGTEPYYYYWENAGTFLSDSASINGVTVGDTAIYFYVSDDSGCDAWVDTMLYWDNYNSDTSIVMLQQPDCDNAGILTAVNGLGQPVITNWQWNGNNQVNDTLVVTEAATYFIAVSNCWQGVLYPDSAVVSAVSGPDAAYTAGLIYCNGGTTTVNITATGGTPTYTGTGSFTAPAGNSSYIVEDANGCTDTVSINLSEPDELEANLASGIINCNGGSATINVTATGGTPAYTGTGGFTAPAGNHSYIVTDANGCKDTVGVNLAEPTVVTGSYTAGTINCNGQTTSINITATGGTPTYTGTGSFTAPAGSHAYIITDANGCKDTLNVSLSQPTAVNATYSAPPVSCNGGNTSISVTASGGTPSYTGTGNFTAPAGSYSYVVTDANSCTDTVDVTITEPTELEAAYTAPPIGCNATSTTVNISATGGTPAYTGTGNYTVPAGTYSYVVNDANGCTDTVSFAVTQAPVLSAGYTASAIVCYGGSSTVQITATGGVPTYAGTGTFTLTAGTYSYTVTDNGGCIDTTDFVITEPTELEATYAAPPISCYGGTTSISIIAGGGTPNYTGTGNFSAAAGSHTYVVTDAQGCKDSVSLVLTQPTAIATTVTPPATMNCDAPVTVTVSNTGGTPPYVITGSTTVTPNTSATFIVTDNAGCKDTTVYTLTLPQGLNTAIAGNDTVCKGENVQLTATGNFNFTWQGNVPNDTLSLTNVQSNTTVTVQGISPEGCLVYDTVTVIAELCIGIKEVADTKWLVYPNPAAYKFTIEWIGNADNMQAYRLYANDGKLVSETHIAPMQTITTVNCSELAAGVYVLQLQVNGAVYYKKLVLEK